MIKLQSVLYILGVILGILAFALFIPMFVDIYYGEDDWLVFLCASMLIGFSGLLLITSNYQKKSDLNTQQAFIMTVLCWVIVPIAAAFPFYFSALELSFIDSIFESVSGLTTTGSTVISGLDNAPPGILIWRAMLQWLGGVGVLIMALSILPFLNIGGMQLFKLEALEDQKVMPKPTKLASNIILIYAIITLLCFVAYRYVGLENFDAIAHAMTTVATGGYSTKDASIGHFEGYGPSFVAMLFMIMGGLPFVLYLQSIKQKAPLMFKDSQVIWFLTICGMCILITIFYLVTNFNYALLDAIKYGGLNVISLITGTGYANANYNLWGTFFITFSFFFMMIGGCAGSTTCGIKIFRFQILATLINTQLKQLLYPHGVFTKRYNGKTVDNHIALSVMSFFFVFAVSFAIVSLLLFLDGLDPVTALSGAATSLANVGPGLGETIGPAGNFSSLSAFSKSILSLAMILGRLEFFTFIVLLNPAFWRS